MKQLLFLSVINFIKYMLGLDPHSHHSVVMKGMSILLILSHAEHTSNILNIRINQLEDGNYLKFVYSLYLQCSTE